ncbi:unnamed protein product, partial [Iphiclides podalirius]
MNRKEKKGRGLSSTGHGEPPWNAVPPPAPAGAVAYLYRPPSVCRRAANYGGDPLSHLRTFTSCGANGPRGPVHATACESGAKCSADIRAACATFRKCRGGITWRRTASASLQTGERQGYGRGQNGTGAYERTQHRTCLCHTQTQSYAASKACSAEYAPSAIKTSTEYMMRGGQRRSRAVKPRWRHAEVCATSASYSAACAPIVTATS